MAHDSPFREQVLAAVDAGATHADVSARFGVSTSSIRSWLSRRRKARRKVEVLPVRVAQPGGVRIELEVGGVIVRIIEGAAPAYVAELVRALRSC